MKKCLSYVALIVFFFTFSFPYQNIYAEQTSIRITSDQQKYRLQTEAIEVVVHLENAVDVFGYSLSFSYPTNKMKFVDCKEGSIFQSDETSFQYRVYESGLVKIGSALLGKKDGFHGDGELFIITMEPIYTGNAMFSIADIVLMNSQLVASSCSANTYEITIYEESNDPVLAVDPVELSFGPVEFGQEPTKTFRIFNSGKGELSGTLDSLTPWLKVQPKRFEKEGVFTVTANTTLLPPHSEYEGFLSIQSNGGTYEYRVTIYVDQDIDTEPPFLNILTPESGYRTNNKQIFFLCETEPGAYASINDQHIAVDEEDGVFYYRTFLKEGKSTFVVKVWDVHQNSFSKTIHIELDTIPPSLSIDPVPLQVVEQSIEVTGKTDPDANLLFNGMEVFVQKDGTFRVHYEIMHKINQLIFTAKDDLENEVTKYAVFFYKPPFDNIIILTVGEAMGTFNEKEFFLDASPQILNGRVFVPIRAIADIYGADIEWNSDTKEMEISLVAIHVFLKIGDVQARIEDDKLGVRHVVLDAPPYIVNGRTMVPLRFISESFGANVEYISETKQIMIRF
ncbi:MAG: stalk domain-containing protein [Caldisericia bacterium]|nr:stalk domain-containing protein [Caldisericia bacterium]